MTWSIVARDPKTNQLGIAVASRFFSVGTLVPHIRPGTGAVATQAYVNPLYGIDGLKLLGEGHSPADVIASLTAADEGRRNRQFHLITAAGENAAFTGPDCVDWAGHRVADNVSVAGNMLSGPDVIDETLKTFKKAADLPLVERFLEAMRAGERAGGDKRGRQSAAIVIYRDQEYPWLRLHADDHAEPLEELDRLYRVAQERYLPFAETMPTRQNPSGMRDRSDIDAKIAALEAERVAAGRPSASFAVPPAS